MSISFLPVLPSVPCEDASPAISLYLNVIRSDCVSALMFSQGEVKRRPAYIAGFQKLRQHYRLLHRVRKNFM
jgi:hypothetical protein